MVLLISFFQTINTAVVAKSTIRVTPTTDVDEAIAAARFSFSDIVALG